MSDFADRLREERCRLGLNQNAFGAIGGVTLDAQSRYERSQRSPNAEYLMAIAAAGADVCYIITGTRAGAVTSTPPAPSGLTEEDEEFLEVFHQVTAEGRKALFATAKAMKKEAKTDRLPAEDARWDNTGMDVKKAG